MKYRQNLLFLILTIGVIYSCASNNDYWNATGGLLHEPLPAPSEPLPFVWQLNAIEYLYETGDSIEAVPLQLDKKRRKYLNQDPSFYFVKIQADGSVDSIETLVSQSKLVDSLVINFLGSSKFKPIETYKGKSIRYSVLLTAKTINDDIRFIDPKRIWFEGSGWPQAPTIYKGLAHIMQGIDMTGFENQTGGNLSAISVINENGYVVQCYLIDPPSEALGRMIETMLRGCEWSPGIFKGKYIMGMNFESIDFELEN